ncbi:hypothetical protein [Yinghuangia sp. YIM S09857]|uniref:hypothetical protein n=1 Tax=Yinghuangia sp. YIM S09857 TaxID=3436929 RepID=UPI003F52A8BB
MSVASWYAVDLMSGCRKAYVSPLTTSTSASTAASKSASSQPRLRAAASRTPTSLLP